jgi:hypothetical protein
MARDALAVMLEIPAEGIEVEVRPLLPEQLAQAAESVRRARSEAEARSASATEAAADLARRLTDVGMSVRVMRALSWGSLPSGSRNLCIAPIVRKGERPPEGTP